MFVKLAIKNVKKSFKDYIIYFLTLTFSVYIFYIFNSADGFIENLELSDNMRKILQSADVIMRALSVLVAGVLTFLMIYANNFLMRRRKREFGIYMVLGMKKSKISMLLIIETFIVGIMSLISGLILGVFLSQGLSNVIAKMIGVNITKFEFVFSKQTCIETSVLFAITFLIIMIFNALSVSKYKLIDLLRSREKNENMVLEKTWISTLIFAISIFCFAYAYFFFFNIDAEKNIFDIFNDSTKSTYLALICFGVGTFLLFISMAFIILKVFTGNKKIYYKGLNIFTIKQISSKINSTRIAMAFISLMLFIGIFAITFCSAMSSLLKQDINCDFDLTIMKHNQVFEDVETEKQSVTDIIKKKIDIDEVFERYKEYAIFSNINSLGKEVISADINNFNNFDIMNISSYNSILEFAGKSAINLSEDQYAIIIEEANENGMDTELKSLVDNNIKKFLMDERIIKVNGKELKTYNREIIYSQFANFVGGNILVVVPDNVTSDMIVKESFLNANYKGDKNETNEKICKTLMNDKGLGYSAFNEESGIFVYSKTNIVEQLIGGQLILICTGMYLGIIFMLASAAILALQQLSEVSDNAYRYNLLRRLGTPKNMIRGSVFKQVSIYFFVPLVFALINVFGALLVADKLVRDNMRTGVSKDSLIFAGAIIIAVYGIYYLITFLGCNRLANQSKNGLE